MAIDGLKLIKPAGRAFQETIETNISQQIVGFFCFEKYLSVAYTLIILQFARLSANYVRCIAFLSVIH